MFNNTGKKEISHSAISDRLSTMPLAFFSNSYELIYQRFSALYTEKEVANMYLQRVDSTLVKDVSNKLKEGLTCGNEHVKKKMIKYTLNFDGMFGSLGCIHTQAEYTSECLALPENVLSHFKKEQNHATVYLFDRGQCSAEAFKEMKGQDGLQFIGRLQDNRKLNIIQKSDTETEAFSQGKLLLDAEVQLYKKDKNSNSNKPVLVKENFRVIRFLPAGKKKEITLITNLFTVSAEDIAAMYRRRWDIETFFRFIKQELNFSHFLSLNENGIMIVLYMTMITAMLVMIYKKENGLGCKTAIRRMIIELEYILMKLVVHECGGDWTKAKLPYP
ncbi:hypothetical protein FACS1894162_6560 [Bacteroidia bacterium]|nr:hypothetical protein FACS1894162_6560 [Bacteroidia bacterium]